MSLFNLYSKSSFYVLSSFDVHVLNDEEDMYMRLTVLQKMNESQDGLLKLGDEIQEFNWVI